MKKNTHNYIPYKTLLYLLGGITVALVCTYLFLLASTTTQVTMRKTLMNDIRDTQGAVAELESRYLAQRKSLSLAAAYDRGFVEASSDAFVYTNETTSMALADSTVQ